MKPKYGTRILLLLLALLLTLTACGGGTGAETTDGSGETTTGGEVTSGDEVTTEATTTVEEEETTIDEVTTEGKVEPTEPEPADQLDKYDDPALFMTPVWSLKTHTDANGVNCRVIQGGCTDGTYLYVAFNDGGSKNPNSISAIRKYHIATRSLVTTYENLKISHCNDMTFNPETNELLMVHNSPDREHISIYDADSLEFKEMITIDLDIYSIAYDPYEQCYWVGISYGYTFAKLDFDFQQVGDIYQGYESGYTKQGMDIDSKYIYFLQYGKNCIMVYDKSGAFVREIPLPKTNHEPENICHIGDDFYVGYLESGGGTMYLVEIGEKKPDPFSVTMEQIGTVSAYTTSGGTKMKMVQGLCTDGTYLYLAQNDSTTQTSIIRKIDPKTGAVLDTYEGIEAGLTNDLLYRPDTDEIIAVHNGKTRSKVSVYKADTLDHVKTVDLGVDIYAMSYDPAAKQYIAGLSGGYNYARFSLDFKQVGGVITGPSLGNTKQGSDCNGTYFCMIMSAANTLGLYKADGTFIGSVALPVTTNAAQDICHIGNDYYIIYANGENGILYRASITVNE
ncbi:MAG: hypothetical protein J6B77_05065 [Clostridia bacterium]|nr:hypothetical protein [Clostridia bacterium]